VRRLVLLVSAIVFADTVLYAALTPLLPDFADRFDLSKTGAGLLVGAYAAGALAGGIPGGLTAARFGPRRAVLGGLVLVAVASIGFAFAPTAWTLGLARLAQGLGSAFTWAGAFTWLLARTPRARRGEMIGTALGAAIFGALFGPVLGGIASVIGEGPAFGGFASLMIVLLLLALREEDAPAEPQRLDALRRVLREPRFAGGLWLMALPSMLFGVLAVLAPLELDNAGWGTAAIAAVFLSGAGLEAALNPLIGRVLDRRGWRQPIVAALLASATVSLALALADGAWAIAALILAAAVAYGGFWTGAMSLLSEGAERQGVAQGLAFGVMNSAWAVGALSGPAVGGAIAQATSDTTTYLLAAAVCVVTLAVVHAGARVALTPGRTSTTLAAPDERKEVRTYD
jgi:MFS family permease